LDGLLKESSSIDEKYLVYPIDKLANFEDKFQKIKDAIAGISGQFDVIEAKIEEQSQMLTRVSDQSNLEVVKTIKQELQEKKQALSEIEACFD